MSLFEAAQVILEFKEKLKLLLDNNKLLYRVLYFVLDDDKQKTIELKKLKKVNLELRKKLKEKNGT